MATVSGAIPNLMGGVSQQPPEIRALNTSTALTNTWSSVISGLSTRSYTDYITDLGAKPVGTKTVASHGIGKGTGNYIVTVCDGEVTVLNLGTGLTETVTVLNSADDYLATDDAAANIRFNTVRDTTFILNKTVTVTATNTAETGLTGITVSPSTRRNPNRLGTWWIRQNTGYNCNYSIYMNNVLLANSTADDVPKTISNNIQTAISTGGTDEPTSFAEVTDTIVTMQFPNETDYIVATDDFGDQATRAYNDKIGEFTDLPSMDLDGRMVLIEQESSNPGDDYWVWYYKGEWQETYGWNNYESLDADTMPVVLLDDGDGTWTLDLHEWADRETGDSDSNPSPSFIGNTINALFRYKGRMIFLSDENVIASEKNILENFYRTTCTQLVDSDPFDIAASEGRGSALTTGYPWGEDGLLLFSSTDQFMLKGDRDGIVGPNTVEMERVNSYATNGDVDPIGVAANVVFLDNEEETNGFVKLREYQTERVFGKQVALPITDQVPEYIPTGVFKMLNLSTHNSVMLLTSGDGMAVYMYNYYYNSDGKVQSAWQRQEYRYALESIVSVNDNIYHVGLMDGDLIVTQQAFSDGVSPLFTDDDILLDQRMYSDDLGIGMNGSDTEITMPYDVDNNGDLEDICVVIAPDNSGALEAGRIIEVDPSSTGTNLVVADIDLTTEDFWVGYRYEFVWELSPVYMRDADLIAIQDGRLQLARLSLLFNESGPFQTEVTPLRRATFIKYWTGFTIGESLLGPVGLDSGEFEFSAPGLSGQTTTVVRGRTPYRVRFSSVEWKGRFRPKSKRT